MNGPRKPVEILPQAAETRRREDLDAGACRHSTLRDQRPACGSPAAGAAAVVVVAGALGGCGANIQAVYEGDMRFEHCIALDEEPAVTLMIQRACWTEWLAFYTYGQTRDRVRYAESRIVDLSETGAVPIEDVVLATPEPLQAPEPDRLDRAPPIMEPTAADAGPPSIQVSAASQAAAERLLCMGRCSDIRDECRRQCRDRSCEQGCSGGFSGCARQCPR